MLVIRLNLTPEGRIDSCRMEGHAGAGEKDRLVCAAASVLARTAVRTLQTAPPDRPGVDILAQAPAPGLLEFTILSCPAPAGEWLRGVGDALITGFRDLAAESPDCLRLEITPRPRSGGSERPTKPAGPLDDKAEKVKAP